MDTELVSRRIRMVREALGFSQGEFGLIMTSRKGGRLVGRTISHIERGNQGLSHEQLVELVDFLEDPSSYLEEALGPAGYTDWTALNYLVWFHPDDRVSNGSKILKPREVPNRRTRLEAVIYDILSQQIEQTEWENMLSVLSSHSSTRWKRELLLPKSYFGVASRLDRNTFERLLAKDFETHGIGIECILDYSRSQLEYGKAHKESGDLFSSFLGPMMIDDQSFQDWWASLSWEEAYAFNKGLRVMFNVLELKEEGRDLILAGLRLASSNLNLIMRAERHSLKLKSESEKNMNKLKSIAKQIPNAYQDFSGISRKICSLFEEEEIDGSLSRHPEMKSLVEEADHSEQELDDLLKSRGLLGTEEMFGITLNRWTERNP